MFFKASVMAPPKPQKAGRKLRKKCKNKKNNKCFK